MSTAVEVLKPSTEVAEVKGQVETIEEVRVVSGPSIDVEKFEMQQRMARLFAASGAFQDIKGASETQAIALAFVKIALGDSMGFTPAESMSGIDIIKGRPAIGSQLRAARMQRAGYSWPQMVLNDKGCWLPLCKDGKPLMAPKRKPSGEVECDKDGKPIMAQVVVEFTEEHAKAAQLLGGSESMYKKHPRNMYFSRAITNAQKWHAPGILSGDIPSTEEVLSDPAYFEPPSRIAVPQRKSEAPCEGGDGGLLPGMAGETAKYPD